MKRARDVREQLVGLMQRVEMELVSGITETINIRKVYIHIQQVNIILFCKIMEFCLILFRLLQLVIFIT